MSMSGKRIKLTDKKNKNDVFPMCNQVETWEHVMLCDNQCEKREEWLKKLKKSLHHVAKKGKETMHELNVVNEIIKDVGKYFNNEQNFWTNQQVIGIREVLKGIAVKNWVLFPVESTEFKKYNKILINKEFDFYSECWKDRFKMLHSPEIRK